MKEKLNINNQQIEFEIISHRKNEIIFSLHGKSYQYINAGMEDGHMILESPHHTHTSKIPISFGPTGNWQGIINGKGVCIITPKKKTKKRIRSAAVATSSFVPMGETSSTADSQEKEKIAVGVGYFLHKMGK